MVLNRMISNKIENKGEKLSLHSLNVQWGRRWRHPLPNYNVCKTSSNIALSMDHSFSKTLAWKEYIKIKTQKMEPPKYIPTTSIYGPPSRPKKFPRPYVCPFSTFIRQTPPQSYTLTPLPLWKLLHNCFNPFTNYTAWNHLHVIFGLYPQYSRERNRFLD